MTQTGFLQIIGLGISVLMALVSPHILPLPLKSPRLRALCQVICFGAALGVVQWSTQNDKVLVFERSLKGLETISQIEYCNEGAKIKHHAPGLAAAQFEKFKRSLEKTSLVPVKTAGAKPIKNKEIENEICNGRLKEESWLHFRIRLAFRELKAAEEIWNSWSLSLVLIQVSRDFFSISYRAQSYLTGLMEWGWIFFQTGEFKTSFHQLWFENLIVERYYPSSKDLARKLISSESPDWLFIQQLFLFLLPEPQRWKPDRVTPQLLPLPKRNFCQEVADHPSLTPQTASVWNSLKLFHEGCQRRKQVLGKLPEDCSSETIQKSLTISCVESATEGEKLSIVSTPLKWPGIPESLGLSTQTLFVPKDYFGNNKKKRPYLAYRLAYAFESTLFPKMEKVNLQTKDENSLFDFDRPSMLTGNSFELTRLEILSTLNPFVPEELSGSLQDYFWYDRFGLRIERFKKYFIRNLHQFKGELE